MSEQVYVEIYERKSGTVETCMGPMEPSRAEKVESGARINMNLVEWSTRIVARPTQQEA